MIFMFVCLYGYFYFYLHFSNIYFYVLFIFYLFLFHLVKGSDCQSEWPECLFPLNSFLGSLACPHYFDLPSLLCAFLPFFPSHVIHQSPNPL